MMIAANETIKEHCINILEKIFTDGLCECDLSGISVGCLIEVLEKMGYEVIGDEGYDHPNLETNGWDIDFWAEIYSKSDNEAQFYIRGNVIYGQLEIKSHETNR